MPRIEALAARYASAVEVGLAADVVLAALESGRVRFPANSALEHSLRQMAQPDEATADAALGFNGRPYTRYLRGHTIRYPGVSGQTFTRDLWLIRPPTLVPVAVVLEYDDDAGTGIMNAAERVAAAVDDSFEGFTTVLHFRTGHESLQNLWFPIPKRSDGTFEFGASLSEVPGVAETLRAAKLI